MTAELRKSERRSFGQQAWIKAYISGVESLVACKVTDVSPGGARLAFRSAGDIPERFGLRFSKTAQTSKACRVVWRTRDVIGVEFVD